MPKNRSRLCPKCKGHKKTLHRGIIGYTESYELKCDRCGGTGRVQ
jgi:DnaJ-class molecular chaperone